jgi:pseudouridine-5'-phosphate glycosidase
VLETKGVPVVGYGVDELPAFWSRSSGIASPIRLDTADEIAAFQRAREALAIDGGLLVANPLDASQEIDSETVGVWIREALADAGRDGITGKATTPYLLKRIFELSEGRSLAVNIELVRSNARLAAAIAIALKALDEG